MYGHYCFLFYSRFIIFLRFALILVLILSFATPLARAAVISVPADYSTIQAAINASFDGDEIIVSPGTYLENIYFKSRDITLRSIDPTSPTVVSTTIIDGNSSGTVVTFSGTETSSCTLSGFTITNGFARMADGGGIFGGGTRATIQYNIITSNTAEGTKYYGNGGGMYLCKGLIQNNIITYNTAQSGGGIYNCHGNIQNIQKRCLLRRRDCFVRCDHQKQ